MTGAAGRALASIHPHPYGRVTARTREGIVGKHRSPIADDGHQPGRPIPPAPEDEGVGDDDGQEQDDVS